VEAGALGDAVDAALMLAAGDDVPPLGRWAVATVAAGGAALGAAVAPRLEQASDFERAGGASFNATV